MRLLFSRSQGGTTCSASDNARNTWSGVVVRGRAPSRPTPGFLRSAPPNHRAVPVKRGEINGIESFLLLSSLVVETLSF